MTETTRVAGVALAASSVSVAVITRRVDARRIAAAATFTSRAPGDERAADLAAVADRAVCAAVLAVVGPSPAGRGRSPSAGCAGRSQRPWRPHAHRPHR